MFSFTVTLNRIALYNQKEKRKKFSMHRILSTRLVGLISICLVCTFLVSLHNLGKEGINSRDFFTFVFVQTEEEKFSRSKRGGETVDFNTHSPLENISAPRYDL